MKKPTFRPGLRDQQRAVKTHMQGLARLHGVTLPEGALSDVKDKIARGPRKDSGNVYRKLESEVNKEIDAVKKQFPNVKLWRNNRGQVMLPSGGRLSYGVGPNGASDFIGYRKIKITHEMVGRFIAQFLCVESKRPGEYATKEQIGFINGVSLDGGYGDVVHSGEELIKFLQDK